MTLTNHSYRPTHGSEGFAGNGLADAYQSGGGAGKLITRRCTGQQTDALCGLDRYVYNSLQNK